MRPPSLKHNNLLISLRSDPQNCFMKQLYIRGVNFELKFRTSWTNTRGPVA